MNIATLRELPVAQRLDLVEALWDSIAEDSGAVLDLSPEQKAELDRRLDAHIADPASSIPWEQVRDRLFKGQP